MGGNKWLKRVPPISMGLHLCCNPWFGSVEDCRYYCLPICKTKKIKGGQDTRRGYEREPSCVSMGTSYIVSSYCVGNNGFQLPLLCLCENNLESQHFNLHVLCFSSMKTLLVTCTMRVVIKVFIVDHFF